MTQAILSYVSETLTAGIISFIGTNIDDIFINMIFFAEANSKRQVKSVIAGKYLGMGALVLVSLLGAYCLHSVPDKFAGFLGLIPIALGLKEWISYKRRKESAASEQPSITDMPGSLILNVILVTVSNGADNIGVYVPLFAGYTAFQMILTALIFAGMTAVWCFLGKKLSDLSAVRGILRKYRHVIVPAILMGLGVYILVRNL